MNWRINTLLVLLCFYHSSLLAKEEPIPLVKVGVAADADKLNPLTSVSSNSAWIGEYLYFSLLGTDKASGEYVPLLAEGLPEISADETHFTYRIHPQARFNSGKRIEARDVVFSMKLVKCRYIGNDNNRSQYEAVSKVEAIDEATVRIYLNHPSHQGYKITGSFPIFSADVLDPEARLEAYTFAELSDPKQLTREDAQGLATFGRQINAFGNSFQSFASDAVSGPYLLESWQRKKLLVLEVNDKFWGRKLDTPPNVFFKQSVERIEIHVLQKESDWRSAVFSKSFDVLHGTPVDLYAEFSGIPSLAQKYHFLSRAGTTYDYIGMNIKGKERGRKALFKSEEVRRAMAHLVDVETLLEESYYGLGSRLAVEYPAAHPEFRNEDLELLDLNLSQAKSLLKAAGWEDSDENGLLDLQGNTTFIGEIIYNETALQRKKIAEHLAANAKQLGIILTPVGLNWEDYLARMQSGDYDMTIGSWVADPHEDSYRQLWHQSNWGNGSNFGGFGDPDTDGLIEAYEQAVELPQRQILARIIQARIHEAQPYVFLWTRDQTLVVKKGGFSSVSRTPPGFWLGDWK